MREFVFTIRYEPGVDRLMDLFIEWPRAKARTPSCFATDESMWRIDHVTGPEEALEEIDTAFLDDDWCNECTHAPTCESRRRYEVIERGSTHRVVYTRRDEIHRCHSVPYLAADHIGDGLLFEAERRENRYEWRMLMPEAAGVGALFDAVQSQLRDGLELELGHMTELRRWNRYALTATRLSQVQREAVEAAVERGYYATPRETTVGELSEALDVPRSTLQYRLQGAEERIMDQFVADVL